MLLISPFKALRPKQNNASEVIAPPYDVLDSKEAKEMAKGKPYRFLHISKPEIDLEDGINFNDKKVYKKGAENLSNFIKEGILFQEEEESIYLYEISMNGKIQTGFGCVASIEAYEENLIKKHEYTTPIKEDDRVLNIKELGAQTGPVLLTYKENKQISSILEKNKIGDPIYNVIGPDSSNHKIWIINKKKEIEKIINEVNSLGKLFIADGHHRSAAASRVRNEKIKYNKNHNGSENYNFFLAVAFPHSEMTILDYNRIVIGLNGYSKEGLLTNINKNFLIEEKDKPYKPRKKNEFGMYINKTWYHLVFKEEDKISNDPVKSLDVSILHDFIISPLLGIEDERRDNRIGFVGGARGLKELEKKVDEGSFDIAFSLFPTPIESLIDVADANEVMPPKSTWFEPKLLDGLISHKID